MALDKKKEKTMLLVGGVVGGGALLYVLSKSSGGGQSAPAKTPRGTPSKQVTRTPNPNTASVEGAYYAAKTASAESYDALLSTLSTNRTLQITTANTNAAQTKQTQIGATTAQAIAQAEASAQESVANTQAQAQENQQSQQNTGSWISSILGFLPSIFGFNTGSSNAFAPNPSNDVVNQPVAIPPVFNPNEFINNILNTGGVGVG